MAYQGPNRRTEEANAVLLARIDERVAMLAEVIPTLATKESVGQLKKELASHQENHRWAAGTVIATVSGAAGLVAGVAALLQLFG